MISLIYAIITKSYDRKSINDLFYRESALVEVDKEIVKKMVLELLV